MRRSIVVLHSGCYLVAEKLLPLCGFHLNEGLRFNCPSSLPPKVRLRDVVEALTIFKQLYAPVNHSFSQNQWTHSVWTPPALLLLHILQQLVKTKALQDAYLVLVHNYVQLDGNLSNVNWCNKLFTPSSKQSLLVEVSSHGTIQLMHAQTGQLLASKADITFERLFATIVELAAQRNSSVMSIVGAVFTGKFCADHPQHTKAHAQAMETVRLSAPFDVCVLDYNTARDAEHVSAVQALQHILVAHYELKDTLVCSAGSSNDVTQITCSDKSIDCTLLQNVFAMPPANKSGQLSSVWLHECLNKLSMLV